MKVQTLVAAAVALAASFAPASAASINLAALGLVKGASLAQSSAATVTVDLSIDDFFVSVSDLGVFEGVVYGQPSTASVLAVLFAPLDFTGDLVDFDIDANSAVGLFLDSGTSTYLLAELNLPGSVVFQDGLAIDNASAEIFAVAPVPLPAALPLMLVAVGGLVVAGRRKA